MAQVFYYKVINGARFPKASRTDPRVAFCHEVSREGRKVKTRYLGIKRAPEDTQIQVKSSSDVVEIPRHKHRFIGGFGLNHDIELCADTSCNAQRPSQRNKNVVEIIGRTA